MKCQNKLNIIIEHPKTKKILHLLLCSIVISLINKDLHD